MRTELQKSIEEGAAKIKELQDQFIPLYREYERNIASIKLRDNKILNQIRDIVNTKNDKEHTGRGYPRYYDDAWFTNTGITLRQDADHPHDIRDKDLSWEDIDKLLNENSDEN